MKLLFGLLLSFHSVAIVQAAGDEEDVLIKTIGTVRPTDGLTTTYYCTFRNLWTPERQPANFPTNGYWAGPFMWTHTLDFVPWRASDAVGAGIEYIAEAGFDTELDKEQAKQGEQIGNYVENPDAFLYVSQEQQFVHMPPIAVGLGGHNFLTAIAGMRPSPDWFTGFYSFWLVDDYESTWYEHFKIQTYPWDAGTDAGKTYTSVDEDEDPPKPLERFRDNNAPEDGSLKGPDGKIAPTGEFECFLIVGDEALVMPACDWFANPCCNETDTVNCGAKLPNGATPVLSDAYSQVSNGSGAADANNIFGMVLALGAGVLAQFLL